MTNASQTVEDIVKQSKKKWENFEIDSPIVDKKKLFDSAKTPLDPRIYKGEAKAYISENENYESSVSLQERMSQKSKTVNDWFRNERYDIEKQLPPGRRGYNFKRDTAGGSFEDIAKQYLMGEGKELYAHLRKQGRDFYDITRIGTADLENAVAALATNGVEAALLGSKDFEQKVSQLASHYGISTKRAITYVMAHEFVHASQKGKYFDDPVLAELDVEHTLKEYFSQKGDHDLAAVAGDRASNVSSNYGGIGSYKMPARRGGLESYVGKGVSRAGYTSSAAGKASAGSYAAASAN